MEYLLIPLAWCWDIQFVGPWLPHLLDAHSNRSEPLPPNHQLSPDRLRIRSNYRNPPKDVEQ